MNVRYLVGTSRGSTIVDQLLHDRVDRRYVDIRQGVGVGNVNREEDKLTSSEGRSE